MLVHAPSRSMPCTQLALKAVHILPDKLTGPDKFKLHLQICSYLELISCGSLSSVWRRLHARRCFVAGESWSL